MGMGKKAKCKPEQGSLKYSVSHYYNIQVNKKNIVTLYKNRGLESLSFCCLTLPQTSPVFYVSAVQVF